MICPRCGSEDLSVVDSRGEATTIRRRRECQGCNTRFTTIERLEGSAPMIIKKDGRREAFSLEKVRSGLVKACEKRPISVETIDKVLESIERKITGLHEKEVSSSLVGELVMERLKDIDKVAYVRFASVYQEFSDVKQFFDTLKELK